ncbi:UNVERIFIED_CONTAM: hypothetical protein Sradi_7203200 [Sesamum radiatum]|uniref:DUF4283 domain-containing protein n=1 Tax=Sesamum radiatum TaxID=300843 RepID=A0AAW2IQ59_SESRA
MRVFKWTPTFTPTQESSIVPVWVCFPELPAHLFHKDALFAVASMIGTPLQIDDFTSNQSKLSKARIGIEIDLTTPLVEEFDLRINETTIRQKVVYEQVSKILQPLQTCGTRQLGVLLYGKTPRPPPRNHTVRQAKGKEKKMTDERVAMEIGECSKTVEDCPRYASVDTSYEATNNERMIMHALW